MSKSSQVAPAGQGLSAQDTVVAMEMVVTEMSGACTEEGLIDGQTSGTKEMCVRCQTSQYFKKWRAATKQCHMVRSLNGNIF